MNARVLVIVGIVLLTGFANTSKSQAPAGWPYYSDSPLYHPSASRVAVGQVLPVFPGISSKGEPIFPMPWPTPPPTESVFRFVDSPVKQPTVDQEEPIATSLPVEEIRPRMPLVDPDVFLTRSQEWREYDISSYTFRFAPSECPEQAIRDWILRETGPTSWHRGEVSSLAISPERVRVYHNHRVQQRVADLLGRFLNYVPGQFHCRVRVLNVTNLQWRKKLALISHPANDERVGRGIWLIANGEAKRLLGELSTGSDGVLLANPELVVANGQQAQVQWSSGESEGFESEQSAAVSPTDRNRVVVSFSPLIDLDAQSIELYLDVTLHRETRVHQKRSGPFGRRAEVLAPRATELTERLKLPPDKHLLISLGIVPSFEPEPKSLFGSNHSRQAEILVLIEIRPAQHNAVVQRDTL